jgi:multidrug efflux pump subunit AcrA (membrane-fusion protein)
MKNIGKLLLIVIAAGFWWACGPRDRSREEAGATLRGVSVETVRLQDTPELLDVAGTIRSAHTSLLRAQISGTVREMRVQEGDRVRRGQVLAVLDDRSPRAQLGVAQAGVEEASQGLAEAEQVLQAAAADRQFAEATYRRYQALLAKNSLSRQEFEGAEARYKAALANERAAEAKKKQLAARGDQARSQADSAQAVYSYARIVAPLDGLVTAKAVDAGTVVMPGTPIFTVEDTGRYRLEAGLPEQHLADVKVGQEVEVTTGRSKLPGRVAEIVPAADAATRTFLVKIDLPRTCDCRSGQYGKASLALGSVKRLVVPHLAVVEHGELQGVFVVKAQGLVEYRLVKTGKDLGDRVEILSGLAAGERVATSQTDRLRDGLRVEGI